MTVLDDILARKREEVAALRRDLGEAALAERAAAADAPRGFADALRQATAPVVIAEFKRASPSRGEIRPGASPADIARCYEAGGATCLSVLTDGPGFDGCLEDLEAARGASSLPVLRKDFTIEAIQLVEARAHGADAVLLIVGALDDVALQDLSQAAKALGLDTIVEVHTREQVERALAAGAELIGINNRDLRTFATDVGVTRRLFPLCGGRFVISESGLSHPGVVASLVAEGVRGFLVGEALMREPDPGEALRRLRGEPR